MQGGFFSKSEKKKPDKTQDGGTSQDQSLRLEKSQGLLKDPLRTRNQPGGFAQIQRYLGIQYTLETCKEFLGPTWHELVKELKDIARIPEEFPEPSHTLKAIDRLLKQAIETGDAALSKELKIGSKEMPRFVAYMAEFHVCQALRDAGTLDLLRAGALSYGVLIGRDEETRSERDALLSIASILLCPGHSFMDGSVGLDGQQVKLAPKAEVLQQLRTQPEIVLLALEKWSVDGGRSQAEADSSVALHFLNPLAWGEDHDDLIKAQLAQLLRFPADKAAFAFGLCLGSKCIRVLELVLQLMRRMAGTSKDVAKCILSCDPPSNEQRMSFSIPMLKSRTWMNFMGSILTTASLVSPLPDQSSPEARARAQAIQRLAHNIDVIFHLGVVEVPNDTSTARSAPGDCTMTCLWPDTLLAAYAALKFQQILYTGSKSKQMVILGTLQPPYLSSRALLAKNAIDAMGTVIKKLSLDSFTRKEAAEILGVLALLLQSATPVDRANLCIKYCSTIEILTRTILIWAECCSIWIPMEDNFVQAAESRKAADREEIREIQSEVPVDVIVHDERQKDEMVRELWDLRREDPEDLYESIVLQGLVQALNAVNALYPAAIPINPRQPHAYHKQLCDRLTRFTEGNELSCVWLRKQEAMQAPLQKAREILQDYRGAVETEMRESRGNSAQKQGKSAKKKGSKSKNNNSKDQATEGAAAGAAASSSSSSAAAAAPSAAAEAATPSAASPAAATVLEAAAPGAAETPPAAPSAAANEAPTAAASPTAVTAPSIAATSAAAETSLAAPHPSAGKAAPSASARVAPSRAAKAALAEAAKFLPSAPSAAPSAAVTPAAAALSEAAATTAAQAPSTGDQAADQQESSAASSSAHPMALLVRELLDSRSSADTPAAEEVTSKNGGATTSSSSHNNRSTDSCSNVPSEQSTSKSGSAASSGSVTNGASSSTKGAAGDSSMNSSSSYPTECPPGFETALESTEQVCETFAPQILAYYEAKLAERFCDPGIRRKKLEPFRAAVHASATEWKRTMHARAWDRCRARTPPWSLKMVACHVFYGMHRDAMQFFEGSEGSEDAQWLGLASKEEVEQHAGLFAQAVEAGEKALQLVHSMQKMTPLLLETAAKGASEKEQVVKLLNKAFKDASTAETHAYDCCIQMLETRGSLMNDENIEGLRVPGRMLKSVEVAFAKLEMIYNMVKGLLSMVDLGPGSDNPSESPAQTCERPQQPQSQYHLQEMEQALEDKKPLFHKLHICLGCSEVGAGFKRCAVCGGRFCSAECQRQSWPEHKKVCGKPAAK